MNSLRWRKSALADPRTREAGQAASSADTASDHECCIGGYPLLAGTRASADQCPETHNQARQIAAEYRDVRQMCHGATNTSNCS